jgi:hypothetical protein
MREGNIEQQFKAIEQQLALTGEHLEALRQKYREHMDDLRLELEVLRRCLLHLHPDLAEHYEAIRSQVIHEVDPEKG